ncbi:VWA domain-containing protein [Ectopseudomonas mendocina]|uniref:VWA domain-containing protein n=1 Tax=Ectopseudomonas mendocina TaxID=300 RepID=A0ABZ2RBJ2_ECTME
MSALLDLWPHWQRPFWLLLLPLLSYLLWRLWHLKKRTGRWQALLPAAFHATLLSTQTGRQSRLPWYALCLAWLLALLALMGPSWERIEQSSPKPANPLVVMIEMTPDMLASDASPNRLEQAKRKLLDLLEARPDSQTAVIVYAGSAHTVVPLSDDLATSRNLLDAMTPTIMPKPGKRADLAVAKALQLLEQGSQGNGRLLIITSALTQAEEQGISQALSGNSNRLNILGVGSPEGAPILLEDGSFMKDSQGAIIMPRLDNAGLSSFASKVGARYQRATLDESDLHTLGLFDSGRSIREDNQMVRLEAWADHSHWLLLALLLIAACGARRGWLLCLPLLLCLPQNSYAFSFTDLWLRPDQQGQRLLEAQKPKEAAERFSDPRWQGNALYQAGDYAAAAERFAHGDSAADHYNRGNALARSNELEAAIEAYDQALEIQPDFPQASKNKALIEQLMQQSQSQSNASEDQQQDQQNEQQQQANGQSDNQNQQQNQQPEQPQDASAEPEQAQPKAPQNNTSDQQQSAEKQPDKQPDNAAQQQASTDPALDEERRQSLEQWLRQIPDDPGELLRRKFRLEQQRLEQQQ